MYADAPQVFLQPIDVDYDDDTWVETTENVLTYLQDRMVDFQFSDHDTKIDQLRLAFANADRALCDHPGFVVGQKYLCSWGWPGAMAPPRRMIVAKRENGDPYVVWLRDPMILLAQRHKSRFMARVTDAEWVSRVAAEYGYAGPTARIAPTEARHDISQPAKRTDATHLARLARRNGFEFYIDGEGLYWGPRQLNGKPQRTLIYQADPVGGDILEAPRFEQVTDRAPTKVTVIARDPVAKQRVTVSLSPSTDDDVGLGSEIELDDPDDSAGSKRAQRTTRIHVIAAGYLTQLEAVALARATYRDAVQGMYTMALRLRGDAALQAKRTVRLRGHSMTYDGSYYVREAVHSIASGRFVTELRCERDALTQVRVARKTLKRVVSRYQEADTAATATPDPLRRKVSLGFGPDGAPITTYVYVEDESDLVGPLQDLTVEDIRALDNVTKRAMARDAAATALPDQ